MREPVVARLLNLAPIVVGNVVRRLRDVAVDDVAMVDVSGATLARQVHRVLGQLLEARDQQRYELPTCAVAVPPLVNVKNRLQFLV